MGTYIFCFRSGWQLVYFSYTGESLDKETPLLSSMDEVSREALRILRLFGDKETKRVAASVGAEQSELYEKIQKLKAALAESKQSVEDARKWIEIVKRYSRSTELTAEPLNNMIDKIEMDLQSGFSMPGIGFAWLSAG